MCQGCLRVVNRLRPETEQGRATARLSEGIAQMRNHQIALEPWIFCFEKISNQKLSTIRFLVPVMIGWPSGLRRQFKALVSSGARVRIPSQSFCFLWNKKHSARGGIRTHDPKLTKLVQ